MLLPAATLLLLASSSAQSMHEAVSQTDNLDSIEDALNALMTMLMGYSQEKGLSEYQNDYQQRQFDYTQGASSSSGPRNSLRTSTAVYPTLSPSASSSIRLSLEDSIQTGLCPSNNARACFNDYDSNRDGYITEAELKYNSFIENNRQTLLKNEYILNSFEAADLDSDRVITRSEFGRLALSGGSNGQQAMQLFEQMDNNGQGLDIDAFAELVTAFLGESYSFVPSSFSSHPKALRSKRQTDTVADNAATRAVADLVDNINQGAQSVASSVSDTAHTVESTVVDTAHNVASTATNFGNNVVNNVNRVLTKDEAKLQREAAEQAADSQKTRLKDAAKATREQRDKAAQAAYKQAEREANQIKKQANEQAKAVEKAANREAQAQKKAAEAAAKQLPQPDRDNARDTARAEHDAARERASHDKKVADKQAQLAYDLAKMAAQLTEKEQKRHARLDEKIADNNAEHEAKQAKEAAKREERTSQG